MARFKDFGSTDLSTIENPTFALYGETFTCKKAMQGRALLSMVASSSDANNAAAGAKAITDFFDHVLVEESIARFNTLLEHPDKIIEVEKLSEVVAWLVEEYTSRPTLRPEVSPAGQ